MTSFATTKRTASVAAAAAILASASLAVFAQSTAPRSGYLWHLHQPIYWNDQLPGGPDRYEYAWESIQATDGGRANPENNLRDIFGKDDRVAVYQGRPLDAVQTIQGYGSAGAQITYTGALAENVNSLGQAGQLGYGPGWDNFMRSGYDAKTTGGNPRLDTLTMSFHHALVGLHNEETVYMELRLHQEKMKEIYGPDRSLSKGFFPTEMAFSERLIPVLNEVGIEWSVVSSEKIARACPNFPLVIGSGGVNCDLPNKADQINPEAPDFTREHIDRGCSPVGALPLSYQINTAKYVDPETGEEHKILVVPADQAASWDDGYGTFSPSFLDDVDEYNDPANPSFTLLAHDGDNAYGGGFSYYMENVSSYTDQAFNNGYGVSTVEEFLDDFPDHPQVVHVEDGAWVNADSDFGSPIYINWNYPLLAADGTVDPVNGWHEKPRDWAVFTAALNRVLTAQQISGHEPDFEEILHPGSETHPVDRAWHYYLGSLDSGNMYYGAALDMEVKAAIGANETAEHTDPIIGDGAQDQTPPTIWLPQRHPYNPGSKNFGVQYGYTEQFDDGDFHVYTFIGDVSEPVEATLKYRVDADGENPLSSNQNETYAGGPEVGSWVELPMNKRDFPSENVYNKPEIDYFELPQHIADHYSVEVTGLRSVLIDYYIEAVDAKGNTATSPIQHVWIGDGSNAPAPTPTPQPTLPPDDPNPFVMDGVLDDSACEVSGGLHLAEQDGWLYVAADVPTPEDVFLYVSSDPSQMEDANWAKSGQVGRWDYFLAREGGQSSGFASWFDVAGTEPIPDLADNYEHARSGSFLEGAIRKDLVGGGLAYAALGVFGTADGDSLVDQSPPTLDENANIEGAEYVPVYTGSDDPCAGQVPEMSTIWMLE